MLKMLKMLKVTSLFALALALTACGNIEPPSPDAGAPAIACNTAADCPSGICEGQGCGDGDGVCALEPELRACSLNLQTFCNCEGDQFQAASNCPGQRFASRGACVDDQGL